MRRVLNAFLQLIEHDDSQSLIVSATNNAAILDQALFRRFDDIIYYNLPLSGEIYSLVTNRLGDFRPKHISQAELAKAAEGLSHAEIGQACDDAIKNAILSDKKSVTATSLKMTLRERRSAYGQSSIAS
jgi:AAA+ superfamily predicted ATPase